MTSLVPGQARFRLDRRDGLAERSGDDAPNLPPFSRLRESRIAPLRPDHGVGECVDGLGRVRDHPLLVIRRQAIAEANAQIVKQFDDIHRLMVARLGRLGPVVGSCRARYELAGAVQRMLGHASAAMTLDVYAGLFDDDLDGLPDRMDEAHVYSMCTEASDEAKTKKPNVTQIRSAATELA